MTDRPRSALAPSRYPAVKPVLLFRAWLARPLRRPRWAMKSWISALRLTSTSSEPVVASAVACRAASMASQ